MWAVYRIPLIRLFRNKALMVYIFIALYIVVSAVAYETMYKVKLGERRDVFLVPLFFILFFVMGLRSTSVGVDTDNYSFVFNMISDREPRLLFQNFFFITFEIGFVAFAKFTSYLVDSYYFFQCLEAALFCYLMYNFIRNSTNHFIIAAFVFLGMGLYLQSFNIIRQMLAVALSANAWLYLTKKRYWSFLIFASLAVTFHMSSVVCILIYLMYLLKDKEIFQRLFPALLLVFTFVLNSVVEQMGNFFSRYETHLNAKEIQEANMVKILWGIELAIALYIWYRRHTFNSRERFIAMMSMAYVACNYIALSVSLFERVGTYFSPFVLLLFGVLGNSLTNKTLRIFYCSITCICFMIFFVKSGSTDQYIYSFFFFR